MADKKGEEEKKKPVKELPLDAALVDELTNAILEYEAVNSMSDEEMEEFFSAMSDGQYAEFEKRQSLLETIKSEGVRLVDDSPSEDDDILSDETVPFVDQGSIRAPDEPTFRESLNYGVQEALRTVAPGMFHEDSPEVSDWQGTARPFTRHEPEGNTFYEDAVKDIGTTAGALATGGVGPVSTVGKAALTGGAVRAGMEGFGHLMDSVFSPETAVPPGENLLNMADELGTGAMQGGVDKVLGPLFSSPADRGLTQEALKHFDKGERTRKAAGQLAGYISPNKKYVGRLRNKKSQAPFLEDLETYIRETGIISKTRTPTIREANDALARRYGGYTSSGQFVRNNGTHGIELDAAEATLDAMEGSAFKFRELKSDVLDYVGNKLAHPIIGKVPEGVGKGSEASIILDGVNRRLEALRDSFVPKVVKDEQRKLIKQVEALKKQKERVLKRRGVDATAMHANLNDLNHQIADTAQKLKVVQEAVENPDIPFSALLQEERSLGKRMKELAETQETRKVSHRGRQLDVLRYLRAGYRGGADADNTFRGILGKAASLDPADETGFRRLLAEFGAFEKIRPELDNFLGRAVIGEHLTRPAGEKVKDVAGAIITGPRSVRGDIGAAIRASRATEDAVKSSQWERAMSLLDDDGFVPSGVAQKILPPALPKVTAKVTAARITASELLKNRDSLEALKENIFAQNMKASGFLGDDGTVASDAPIDEARMLIEQQLTGVAMAAQTGSEEAVAMELSLIAEMYPDLPQFVPKSSGIPGEVELGGQRVLPHPHQRERYVREVELQRSTGMLTTTQAAKKVSAVNGYPHVIIDTEARKPSAKKIIKQPVLEVDSQ